MCMLLMLMCMLMLLMCMLLMYVLMLLIKNMLNKIVSNTVDISKYENQITKDELNKPTKDKKALNYSSYDFIFYKLLLENGHGLYKWNQYPVLRR